MFDPKQCNSCIVGYGGVGMIFSIGMLREMVGDSNYFIRSAFKHLDNKNPYSGEWVVAYGVACVWNVGLGIFVRLGTCLLGGRLWQ